MDEPITREEMFMSAAAGESVELPEPITRREKYLKAIADNAGGGSGGGGGGSDSSVLVIGLNMATMTLDKTWQEIMDADFAIIEVKPDEYMKQIAYITSITDAETSFIVSATLGNQTLVFAATSKDGYPVMQGG